MDRARPDPDSEHVRLMAVLRRVADPEIGESIVDLGLVDSLTLGPASVALRLVPTSATCPMADVLIEDAETALRQACPPDWTVEVEVDWDAVWTPQRMSVALRLRLGWA
ncbi:metal-sulfur cluster assembly factor [Roseateles sp. DB2]|uniref:metal-sulfur cluster assembly factor n=1 Tax=Roseateles sp. DB2 TaxID=3453717 RepID=UPI003EE881C3